MVVEEDVVMEIDENSYCIDMVFYWLLFDVCVFGVVFISSVCGLSCLDVNIGEELMLWVCEGDYICFVFGMNLYGWVSVEGDVCGLGVGDVCSEVVCMMIVVEKMLSYGFVDLLIMVYIMKM